MVKNNQNTITCFQRRKLNAKLYLQALMQSKHTFTKFMYRQLREGWEKPQKEYME